MESKTPTLLIVDDEPALRRAMAYDLKKQGYQVLDAGNGREAMQLIEAHPVDIVLTDVQMPDMNGVDLLNEIKARDPELPVVMIITGHADLSLEEAYARGAAAVFSKPFDRRRLLESIKRALTHKYDAWAFRENDRIPVDFQVHLKFENLRGASQGQVLNLGRGGMFATIHEPLPEVDSKVEFSIQFNDGEVKNIEGAGIVRWIRTGTEHEKAEGCGIEFEYLDDSNRKKITDLIDRQKTHAPISKV